LMSRALNLRPENRLVSFTPILRSETDRSRKHRAITTLRSEH